MSRPLSAQKRPLRLAAMISGGGRTLMNLADRIDDGSLNASIGLVISSRANAAGNTKAEQRGFEVRTAFQRDFATEAELHHTTASWWDECQADLVVLCGYLRKLVIPDRWRSRVINIHPALLPQFGGHGMYGDHVHRAVLASGQTLSGCTVHFVDDQYDHGPTILQRTCPILLGDDEHTLATRVFEQECAAYPEAINLIAAGRVRMNRERVEILPPATVRA